MAQGDNALSGAEPFLTRFPFAHEDIAHDVYVEGKGPGVLVLHEMPGFIPEFWRFCHWLTAAGFAVYAPDLYSRIGAPRTKAGVVRGLARACVSREIHLFARNHSSPVTQWLRALARRIHDECGGAGVGAVGMCMTGNFALSLVLEPSVLAAVASEPALPLASSGALHLSADERNALRTRTETAVMALRFEGDPTCKAARFAALEQVVGERLEAVVLPDSAQNPDGLPYPHAVLTADLIDADGEPTREAANRVIARLREKLAA